MTIECKETFRFGIEGKTTSLTPGDEVPLTTIEAISARRVLKVRDDDTISITWTGKYEQFEQMIYTEEEINNLNEHRWHKLESPPISLFDRIIGRRRNYRWKEALPQLPVALK